MRINHTVMRIQGAAVELEKTSGWPDACTNLEARSLAGQKHAEHTGKAKNAQASQVRAAGQRGPFARHKTSVSRTREERGRRGAEGSTGSCVCYNTLGTRLTTPHTNYSKINMLNVFQKTDVSYQPRRARRNKIKEAPKRG